MAARPLQVLAPVVPRRPQAPARASGPAAAVAQTRRRVLAQVKVVAALTQQRAPAKVAVMRLRPVPRALPALVRRG